MNSNVNGVFECLESNDVQALKKNLTSTPSLVNVENVQGLTPLGFASHLGYVNSVQILLDFHADVDEVSHSKVEYIPSNTALHAAIAGARNFEIIELLLKNKAKTDIFDSNGHTALHTAAFHDDNTQLISLLIRHGAPVAAKVDEGKTALELAVEKGNNQVAEQLKQLMDPA
ncbi:ankyrin repeat domain-containing protein [Sporosarcina sp. A2]|uniref:ankyrin repeat domain-containing protein n=1 Tax=Sporosarcina sp. A2 TaxID=3393449 RepID=UPI003D7AC7DF